MLPVGGPEAAFSRPGDAHAPGGLALHLLIIGDLDEFVGRWADWLAQAANRSLLEAMITQGRQRASLRREPPSRRGPETHVGPGGKASRGPTGME